MLIKRIDLLNNILILINKLKFLSITQNFFFFLFFSPFFVLIFFYLKNYNVILKLTALLHTNKNFFTTLILIQ